MNFGDAVTKAVTKGGVATAQAVGGLALSVEASMLIHSARVVSAEIAELSKKLSGDIGCTVALVAIEAQEIIGMVEKDPRDFKAVRSFFDYNLGKSKEVIEARVQLVGHEDAQQGNVDAFEKVIGEILDNFKQCAVKCRSNDVEGAAISAEALSRIMKANI